jgi:hypothetical protein
VNAATKYLRRKNRSSVLRYRLRHELPLQSGA